MNLGTKAEAVKLVLQELDAEIVQFQSWSALGCKFGCGKCCFKPDIEATPLEFFPLAVHFYQNGTVEEWLDKLDSMTSDELCVILNPTQSGAGLCSQYPYRGMICRLFGFSARTNKYEEKELVTCQIIKTEQTENYNAAQAGVAAGKSIPLMADYYLKLHYIDPQLANDFMPINKAIKKALELCRQYFYYKDLEA